MNLYIGTCGWSYKGDWDGVFYPKQLPVNKYLKFYAEVFNTVEIDSSFYHLPSKEVVQNWAQKTPKNFKFSSKIPKTITHDSKLDVNRCSKELLQYFNNLSPLENSNKSLGHLVQLPPSFTYEEHFEDLINFLDFWNTSAKDNKKFRGENSTENKWIPVVEFRNISWMKKSVFKLLESKNAAYCSVIEPLIPPKMEITRKNKDLFYLRFHGYGKKPWWDYLFSQQEISNWAVKIKQTIEKYPKTNHVIYFNNHYSGNAVKNAMDLIPRLGLNNRTNLEQLQHDFLQKEEIMMKKNQSLHKWL